MSDRCDQDVYKNGEVVFITNTIRTKRMEEWVQKIAEISGQKVDWHQYAGRPVVKVIGDIELVRKAILNNREMHDQYYFEALQEFKDSYYTENKSSEMVQSIWNYNRKECGLK